MDEVRMTRPRPEAASAGRHACIERMVPRRLVPSTPSISSSVISASGAAGKIPALAQRTSMPPNRSAAAAERFGGIDVLCANAGIFPAAPLAEMTDEEIDGVLGTNLRGTILSVQACLPALAASGRGRVILTSSITGPITGFPGWAHYGASKAGQLGFLRTAAIEL